MEQLSLVSKAILGIIPLSRIPVAYFTLQISISMKFAYNFMMAMYDACAFTYQR